MTQLLFKDYKASKWDRQYSNPSKLTLRIVFIPFNQ